MRTGSGPVPAKIMLVGEAWGQEEERTGEPFVGTSGIELNRMLHEAGIMRSELYCTNVINARPPSNKLALWIPDKKKDIKQNFVQVKGKWCDPIVAAGVAGLEREIATVMPNLIIAAGNTALWALTGKTGIMKWRGSIFQPQVSGPKVLAVYHPAAVLRQWELRAITVNDLKRVRKQSHDRELRRPAWRFILRPSFAKACEVLHTLLASAENGETWLDLDLETRAGHIACCGISWSRLDAICIPFMSRDDNTGYFTEEQEVEVIHLLYRLLTHPNVKCRLQNGLYDFQYIYRWWHFLPNLGQDTMISHHTLFSGLPKKLDFQASMYCEFYEQWKPDKTVEKEGG